MLDRDASKVMHSAVCCSGGVLEPRGPVASAELTILFDSLAIMLVVVVPVIVITLAFARWFRATNARARYLPNWAYSGRLEFIVWAIPLLIVMFVGGVAWVGSHELDPYKPLASTSRPMHVQVVSLDWKWLFIYPDQNVATINHLVLPVGVPIHFTLTSATVMNSFFVPQLGGQIYTMAGMTSQLFLQADVANTYQGLSAQFSGSGFSDMNFTVEAVAATRFDGWIENARKSAGRLDEAAYRQLLMPGLVAQPKFFGAVDPNMFQNIVAQSITAQIDPDPDSTVSPDVSDGEK